MTRSWIPNSLTSINLLSGCIGLVFAIKGNLEVACLMIWISAVFDFLDGGVARALKAHSELGKQLDSLADIVSFGVLPGALLYALFEKTDPVPIIPWFAFTVTIFSALRLAKFNIDEDQAESFKGLPTPASAIFVSGLPYIRFIELNEYLLLALTAILAFLMVSPMVLLAFKFKDYSWKNNASRYFYLILTISTLILLREQGISLAIIIYVIFSMFFGKEEG